MTYSIDEARHRFSLWAACRAAQAGSAKGKRSELIHALEACGVIAFVRNPKNDSISLKQYDAEYEKWVLGVQKQMRKVKKSVTFGVAAKLVSTYLKSAVVLGGRHETKLGRVLTPPIDSILLKSLDKQYGTHFSKTYRWSMMSKTDYRRLLAELRGRCKKTPIWRLEEHWNP